MSVNVGASGSGGGSGYSSGYSTPPTQGVSAGGFASSSASTGTFLGVTRSRTLLFQSYRDSVPRDSRRTDSAYYDEPLPSLGIPSSSSSRKGKRKQRDLLSEGGTGNGWSSQTGGPEETEDEQAALLNGDASYPPQPRGGHTTIDLSSASSLPPKWVDTSDEVDFLLANSIRPKISQLDKLHAKHLLPSFTDRSKEEQEIESLTTEITREFRKCSRLIATLAQHTQQQQQRLNAQLRRRQSNPEAQTAPVLSQREIALAQNVQTALATKVQDVSGVFRKKQSVYMQRLKGLEVRGRDLAAASGMLSKHGVLHRDNEAAVREDMELSRQQLKSGPSDALLLLEEQELQQQDPSQADANIHQRDREITQIAKSIAELAELFQDLSALVIEQGTMVDRIDWNVENMGKDMQAAVEELNTANRYQRRTGRVQCIMFLLLCIALLIAIIIIKPFWRAATGSSSTPLPPPPPPVSPPSVPPSM